MKTQDLFVKKKIIFTIQFPKLGVCFELQLFVCLRTDSEIDANSLDAETRFICLSAALRLAPWGNATDARQCAKQKGQSQKEKHAASKRGVRKGRGGVGNARVWDTQTQPRRKTLFLSESARSPPRSERRPGRERELTPNNKGPFSGHPSSPARVRLPSPVLTALVRNLVSSPRLFSFLSAISLRGPASSSTERCSMVSQPL